MRTNKYSAGWSLLALLAATPLTVADDIEAPVPPRVAAPRQNPADTPDLAPAPKKKIAKKAQCPEGPPSAILKYMEESLQVVADEQKPAEVRKAFRDAFESILAAVQKVLIHHKATEAEKNEAIQFQASILYQGAKLPVDGYADRLAKLADDLYHSQPKTEVAALAAFLLVKAQHETELGLDSAAIPGIQKYIHNFPRDEAAIELLSEVAANAEMTNRPDKAKEAYGLVVKNFPKNELADKIPAVMKRLDLVGKPLQFSGPALETGKVVDVAAMKNKIVVVLFWATWSQPSITEIDLVRELYEKYHDQGLEVIGVPMDEDPAKLRHFLAEQKLPWVQMELPANEGDRGFDHPRAKEYGILAVPTVFLVDKGGKVTATNVRGAMLEQRIAELLGKPSAPTRIGSRTPVALPPVEIK